MSRLDKNQRIGLRPINKVLIEYKHLHAAVVALDKQRMFHDEAVIVEALTLIAKSNSHINNETSQRIIDTVKLINNKLQVTVDKYNTPII